MSSTSGPTQFAYANTLPNTKTFFPPSDRPYHGSAPWVTQTGFELPNSSVGCSGPTATANDWSGWAASDINCTCFVSGNEYKKCCTAADGTQTCATVQAC